MIGINLDGEYDWSKHPRPKPVREELEDCKIAVKLMPDSSRKSKMLAEIALIENALI